jgi:hypothetical protein
MSVYPDMELYMWWRSIRPNGWTEREHLAHPEGGSVGVHEALLCRRIAHRIKFGGSENGRTRQD